VPGSALLLLDVQAGMLSMNRSLAAQSGVVDRIREAVLTARAAQWLIVAVTFGCRESYPELPPKSLFSWLPETGRFIEGSDDLRIPEAAVPGGPDLIVRKHRQDAFFGTDLDLLLRSAEVERLALTGYTTSGGVLATLKAASDRDYQLTVLADACADNDPVLHGVIVDKIFRPQARITDVSGWQPAALDS
jgi:nicotinamidase-related amidase